MCCKVKFRRCFGVKVSSRTVECCKIKFWCCVDEYGGGLARSGMVKVKWGKVWVLVRRGVDW